MHKMYEIIGEFKSCGMHMVIVKMQCATHVMTMGDWKSVKRSLYYTKENNDRRSGQKNFRTHRKIA